ncbi:MAG: 50S ribosomal protein L29 [Symploca sp. SIO3C6]|uniref:Large ribosomal subunit protein uL29 n=1 Tax=Symploca sp. SIO1C4 TaxID=2607765 RepID=A0A6B3N5M9_9CYAN|nr:50S ribosomal protein L29 [Symploca sp. SIO3C6]NER26867.1 50S ribosomal protein L29 [Symploca sp. SIO1C4]NET05424.1 50S ribosomal protein L29 [Symploca sp. SIO2B6]NET50201.1 50S ribosomal protein L29 [Merismopedia sp. SIO2A8]
MPLPKIEEVRKLNDQELAEAIVAAKRELFELRLQKATQRLEKNHQFKHLRHRISQMMTVERERQIAAAKAAEEASTDTPPTTDQQPDTQPETTEEE